MVELVVVTVNTASYETKGSAVTELVGSVTVSIVSYITRGVL